MAIESSQISNIVNQALETSIISDDNRSFSPVLTKQIEQLHYDVVNLLQASDLIVTQNIISQFELRIYKTLHDYINDPEKIAGNYLTKNQYQSTLLLVEVLGIMASISQLYSDRQSINQISMLCEISKEINDLNDDTIENVVQAYNNLSNSGGRNATGGIETIQTTTTWDDVKGVDEDVFNSIKSMVTNPLILEPKTFLFYGPPGTGKTTIAFGAATVFSEGVLHYFSAQNLSSDTVGATEGMLKRLFDTTRKNPDKNYTIVFDEIDFLTGFEDTAHIKSIIVTLQTNLGAIEHSLGKNVCLIGITNYFNKIPFEITRRLAPFKYIDVPTVEFAFSNLVKRIYSPVKENSFLAGKDGEYDDFIKVLSEQGGVTVAKLLDSNDNSKYFYTLSTVKTIYKNLLALIWQNFGTSNTYFKVFAKNLQADIYIRVYGDVSKFKHDEITVVELQEMELDLDKTIIYPSLDMVNAAIKDADRITQAKRNDYWEQFQKIVQDKEEEEEQENDEQAEKPGPRRSERLYNKKKQNNKQRGG